MKQKQTTHRAALEAMHLEHEVLTRAQPPATGTPREADHPLRRVVLVAAIALVGCSPSPARQQQTTPLDGAVLGSTRANWIAVKGEPGKGVIGDKFGDVEVIWSSGDERARHVELLLPQEQSIGRARDLAKPLPKDSKSVRTYTAPAGQTIEVFRSEAMASALGAEAFGDEEPGTFIQIAERGQPRTRRVLIAAGNRP